MASKSRLGSGGYGIRRKGSFAGKTTDLGVVADAFLASIGTSTAGIKKAGIPADTPAWLRTNLEIYMGRRGNAIPIPAKTTLTFSAAPTQAECEALDAKVNAMHEAMKKLITRFDS
jgi:hypothetical protein